MPVERVSSELERIVSLEQDVEVLVIGYVGGKDRPCWVDYRSLLFSEVRVNSRRNSLPTRRVPL